MILKDFSLLINILWLKYIYAVNYFPNNIMYYLSLEFKLNNFCNLYPFEKSYN